MQLSDEVAMEGSGSAECNKSFGVGDLDAEPPFEAKGKVKSVQSHSVFPGQEDCSSPPNALNASLGLQRSSCLPQQPLSRPLDQEQVTGALANVVPPHVFDLFGVELNLLLAEQRVRSRLK